MIFAAFSFGIQYQDAHILFWDCPHHPPLSFKFTSFRRLGLFKRGQLLPCLLLDFREGSQGRAPLESLASRPAVGGKAQTQEGSWVEASEVCSRGGGLRPNRQLWSPGPQLTLPVPFSPLDQSSLERPSSAGHPCLGLRGTPLRRLGPGTFPPLRTAPGEGGYWRKRRPHLPSAVYYFPERGDKTKQGPRGRKVEGRGPRRGRGWTAPWRWEWALLRAGVRTADQRLLKFTSARPFQVADSPASPLQDPRVPGPACGAPEILLELSPLGSAGLR